MRERTALEFRNAAEQIESHFVAAKIRHFAGDRSAEARTSIVSE
jgi:hypothetical protein